MSRLERWRLILGGEDDGTGHSLEGDLSKQKMDEALSALYDADEKQRRGGLQGSNPKINRWLGDIRTYFPSSVVQILQKDALERLGLQQMLLEPELLEQLEPDVDLVATLISLKNVLPDRTRETARMVVRKVVQQLEKRLKLPTIQTIKGALNRSVRNYRPRYSEIDWKRTIEKNLRHYQKDYKTIIPERLVGFGRKGGTRKEIILAVDQSGSMASSVVYASVFGAVLASMKSLKTSMIAFDTAVVDLSSHLHDPVEVLFGAQLGGGTDINKALQYCQQLIRKPKDSILVLISDLYEGGRREGVIQQAQKLRNQGVSFICLLALNDSGKPAYDEVLANHLSEMGIPVMACSPDVFPVIMAQAIEGKAIRPP
ncbi:MAG: VWA domain-containing protein, partial [Bacteroidota bacterium]